MSIESNLNDDFCRILNITWTAPARYLEEIKKLANFIGEDKQIKNTEKRLKLLQCVNKKFDINKFILNEFIDFSASKKIYFNYHKKEELNVLFNSWNLKGFKVFLEDLNIDKSLQSEMLLYFKPISKEKVIEFLLIQISTGDKKEEILSSLFSAFVFISFPISRIHEHFNSNSSINNEYLSDYYHFLRTSYKHRFERNLGLSILKVDQELVDSFPNIETFYNQIYSYITNKYQELSNNCYLSLLIDPIIINKKNIEWDIYSNIVLYAEKFIEEKLHKGYFHPDLIRDETKKHIVELKESDAAFEIANGGFTYKDCLIIVDGIITKSTAKHLSNDYSLLLLFEKSQRDEEPIPCPTCRSIDVRGNSYPALGVKSWECNNILCYDKSKYNRGKRYSLASLIKQEAIDNENNLIINGTIKEYQLDVVENKHLNSILEFLIKHYSLYNDNVELVNFQCDEKMLHGRIIKTDVLQKTHAITPSFYSSSFFKRFILNKELSINKSEFKDISIFKDHKIFNGDSYFVLNQFPENTIDGAVTSPPYYNAKSYSQWPNIYCYLYDMYNNAREVFRVLKPGAPYLYNIFDYFDNERNIVSSAMGKKRMILGAYIIHLFKHIGFDLIDNIIWYKGHIQGNRSNNQGNQSPYYQAPLNCYEHIFYLRKPGNEIPLIKYPKILKAHPVVKMIKGINTLGHTAPFPNEIPKILTSQLKEGSIILDPYSGSFTTARQADLDGQKSISIEKDYDYCQLGISLLKKINSSALANI